MMIIRTKKFLSSKNGDVEDAATSLPAEQQMTSANLASMVQEITAALVPNLTQLVQSAPVSKTTTETVTVQLEEPSLMTPDVVVNSTVNSTCRFLFHYIFIFRS